jgi:hypothetical protein
MRFFRYIFVVMILGVVGLVIGYKTSTLPSQVKQAVDSVATRLPKTQVALDQALLASQAAQLTERGSQVLEQGTKVLGAAVTVDESQENSSLTDRALNYGRYLYCKQVVEDWETRSSAP